MIAERENLIKKTSSFSALLDSIPCYVKEIWIFIVGYIRTHYIMDELWDGHSELKFRRNGKTLITIYLKPDKVSVLLIFGKAERESFELQYFNFSEYINRRYNDATTYHDGKWIMFDVKDIRVAREIVKLAYIKKKHNRKPVEESMTHSPCGAHCDICMLNKSKNDTQLRRSKAELDLVKSYGSLIKHSESAGSDSKLAQCDKKSFCVNPGLCVPGLTACQVTDYILPLCKGTNEVFFNDGIRINDKDK